jgi:hypothetical protein
LNFFEKAEMIFSFNFCQFLLVSQFIGMFKKGRWQTEWIDILLEAVPKKSENGFN